MSVKYGSKNYGLFDKYLSKISKATIDKFGSLENVIIFLQELCDTGHVGLAAKKITDLSPLVSPLLLHKVIHNDRHLSKCVRLAKNYSAEMAEAVLYDRAINGYEELTYNEQGECIARKKKYCPKSLLEYLKANSPKYQGGNKNNKAINTKTQDNGKTSQLSEIGNFEVEAYGADSDNDTETRTE